MGMYTTLRFVAPLTEWGAAVARDVVSDSWDIALSKRIVPAPMSSWRRVGRCNFIPNGAVSYYPDPGSKIWTFPADEPWQDRDEYGAPDTTRVISDDDVWYVLCSLKNYNSEIQQFLHTVLPYLIRKPVLAEYWYEEADAPTQFRVVPSDPHPPVVFQEADNAIRD